MTEIEAVERFKNDRFTCFPAGEMREKFADTWFDAWEFLGNDYDGIYDYVNEPMWNTWFIPNDGYLHNWIQNHKEKVADCGFTIILDADDYRCKSAFALGIDGVGYSFLERHFLPLYRAMGLEWHDEE